MVKGVIPISVVMALSGEDTCSACGCPFTDHLPDGVPFPSTHHVCLCGDCYLDAGGYTDEAPDAYRYSP
jgi:hypothetical protein